MLGGGSLWSVWRGWWTPRKTFLLVLDNMGISLQVNTCFCGKETNICGQGMVEGGGPAAAAVFHCSLNSADLCLYPLTFGLPSACGLTSPKVQALHKTHFHIPLQDSTLHTDILLQARPCIFQPGGFTGWGLSLIHI